MLHEGSLVHVTLTVDYKAPPYAWLHQNAPTRRYTRTVQRELTLLPYQRMILLKFLAIAVTLGTYSACALLNFIYIRCGTGKLKCHRFSHHVLLYLRMVYIVWSLLRRRVTRRLTRLQTMDNVLKHMYSKTL